MQKITMLINDLLNTMFDQSSYETQVVLMSMHKRKTTYADKYSSLKHHTNIRNLKDICKKGSVKALEHTINDIDIHVKLFTNCCEYFCDDHVCKDHALWLSAKFGNVSTVKYLLGVGLDVSACCGLALRLSAQEGHLDMVKYLVNIGADAHGAGDDALYVSASRGHLETVKYLVGVGANIGRWSLLNSAREGHLETVKYLTSVGANIHLMNDLALRCSAKNGHLEVIKYLVGIGANINVNDNELFELKIINDNFSHLK